MKRMTHIVAAGLSLSVAALFGSSAFALAMPEIVSHRGESADRPENSMAAFRLAFERGVGGVECDVYATSDGVPVIIHDSTTGRTAGSGTNLTVTASTWDELKDVRIGAFGSWIGTEYESETIPKLEDYLALLASNDTTRCIIEMKGNGANDLVANVVAAVQAQPLATKDRVVFIAFDFSLIQAVRTALPDYPAWLLYSTAKTGSQFLSDIATYNATGVDVVYTASVSEDAIAAVTSAGYTYAAWTCDDVSTAFSLVKKGVQSVTTNVGGTMLSDLPALIDAYNAQYAEITTDTFDEGLTLIDVGAYVQDGLVGHFDGIRNAGADEPHSMTTTTWKNLVSSGPDANFSHRVASSAGYWTDNAYYFNNSTMASTVDEMSLGNNFTVQITIDAAPGSQKTAQSGNKDGHNGYHAWYNDNPKGNRGFWTLQSTASGSQMVGNFNLFGGPRINLSGWTGKYLTWMLDGANSLAYTFQSAEIPAGTACKVTSNNISVKQCWGGELSGSTLQAFIVGKYHAVRMYNKVLSNNEHLRNRFLDEVRYRGFVTNGVIVVDSNLSGATGTETSGTYFVNGNHTFTAPASVSISDCTYVPGGYKLEQYNYSTKTWDLVGEYTGASYSYTNCLATGGVRLTWNWTMSSGVKKIDADDYVQGGLLLHFDAIRNAGLDAEHDSTATTWKNLVSGPDATRSTFDSSRDAGAWTDKAYNFNASDCFVTDSTVSFTRQATLQVAVDYVNSQQVGYWPVIFGMSDTNVDRFHLYTYHRYSGYENRGDRLMFNVHNVHGITASTQPWNGRTVNAQMDYAKASVTSSATASWQSGSYTADFGSHKFAIGTGQSSNANRQLRGFVGPVHNVRLYDRVLTASELQHNTEVDECRYYGGAGRSTDTDVVEVTSERPEISVDGAGCYIVRGDGASITFNASASVTIGNLTYSCAGYRTETWDSSRRMWTNAVETANATSVTVTGTSGAPNRRITWLWSLTHGLKTASDYNVADYVQQGLVAHYDGICNVGVNAAHSTQTAFWHDLSYRNVPMVGASNTSFYAWNALGHHFTASENSLFMPEESIDLGYEFTMQSVLDAPPSAETVQFPTYIGTSNDHGIFTRDTGATLEGKLDDFCVDITGRPLVENFEGKYINTIVDCVTDMKAYLSQTSERGSGVVASQKSPANDRVWTVGNVNGDASQMATHAMTGDYFAFRIYNRALSDAELAQNMKVDEIRYRSAFTNYCNVTVACEMPFEGVVAPITEAVGDYEVTGSWTFTASNLTIEGTTFEPRYTIETYTDGAWSAAVEYTGGSYTYTDTQDPVRITWKWVGLDTPITATWTGAGDKTNLNDPANWTCYNVYGTELENAAPTDLTTVVIDGTTDFTVPADAESLPWKAIQFGSDLHKATQWGCYALASNSGYLTAGLGLFTVYGEDQGNVTNLFQSGSAGTETSGWQNSYINGKRVRFDGWFYVTSEQAGTWTITQAFDDYYGFAIDGVWLVDNTSYVVTVNATYEATEGWHRFTIIAGSTTGGYGAMFKNGAGILFGDIYVPMTITYGTTVATFSSEYFTFGSGRNTITLSADCDWRALGDVAIPSGTIIDLNGNQLKVAGMYADDYLGAMITNSNDEVTGTLLIDVAEGETEKLEGVGVTGNIQVQKYGAGTYVSTMARSYTEGTIIAEGTAQPPDGSGANITYCRDQFNAFGTNTITVLSGATFDLRANYAYYGWVVLNGGTLTNTKANMTQTGWGGSGIGQLTADSYLNVANSIVFQSPSMDLGGNTLSVYIGNSKNLYIRGTTITNGTIDVTYGGWLYTITECDARTVDFKVGSALNLSADLSVHDYYAKYGSTGYNQGTGALNVYGTFTPATNCYYGCTMQDGSTIDISGWTEPMPLTSAFTAGSNTVSFADSATVNVKLGNRSVNMLSPVISWAAKPDGIDDVKFKSVEGGRTFVTKDDGLYVKQPFVLSIR